ncbi:DNA cytosine methyltransferase [Bacillus haynesii]|uniref:DNA cytosine methyltransferase n=1 Tax=Bacillus haynesii TaxID=1925021 RepID=UPI00227F3826|nr:DNA cytosine methyltransferase [Bacillus haynesii]MCY8673435.1 DNA cytosine methyltransferase [Bacillus haynesii]
MNFIDLFAGAGGLSEGFISVGFEPIAHVEMDKYACDTLKTRYIFHELRKKGDLETYYKYLKGDIKKDTFYSMFPEIEQIVINKEISQETVPSIFLQIEEQLKQNNISSIDLIIGGPPCQAYSLVGRARDPYRKEKDPRNYLYKYYVEFLRKFRPKMFVFENVPGILTAGKGELFKDVQHYLKGAGYKIEAQILDSSDYGVVQKRKRVILIGWQKDSKLYYPRVKKIVHDYKVNDVLRDLPPLEPGERVDFGSYSSKPSKYLYEYGIRGNDDVLTQHISRPHNKRDREIYKIAIENWNNAKVRVKYTDLPEELKTHNNQKSFLDRFKVVSGDNQYSHTVVAHISKDGHYYIHPDINQLRSISVREAARLQSFPDNYFFEGPRTAVFTQIGNAVPPLMAKSIANEIKSLL